MLVIRALVDNTPCTPRLALLPYSSYNSRKGLTLRLEAQSVKRIPRTHRNHKRQQPAQQPEQEVEICRPACSRVSPPDNTYSRLRIAGDGARSGQEKTYNNVAADDIALDDVTTDYTAYDNNDQTTNNYDHEPAGAFADDHNDQSAVKYAAQYYTADSATDDQTKPDHDCIQGANNYRDDSSSRPSYDYHY